MKMSFKKVFVVLCTIIMAFFAVGGVSASASQVAGANAQLSGDWAYVRQANGSIIQGRRVDNGDRIKVWEVNNNTNLAYVQYPTASGNNWGWIKNGGYIKYYYQGQYHNGSTSEPVYADAMLKERIGSLDPWEHATPLYRVNGKLYVVYNTSKGANTKAGFVDYNGGFNGLY